MRTNKTIGRAAVMALPLAVAAACAGAPPAVAAVPSQPGITAPQSQPGITVPAEERPAPPSDYGRRRGIPLPGYAAPVRPERLHPPTPQRPVAPIVPLPNTIRIGGLEAPIPPGMSRRFVETVNIVAAHAEAQVTTFARSVGITPNRADRIAAAAVGGALIGAVSAGGVGAVAGGVVGGAAGGLVGAVAGGAIGGVVGSQAPFAGTTVGIAGGVAIGAAVGVAVGAGVGAVVAGVPTAAAGAVVGGLIGAAVGATAL